MNDITINGATIAVLLPMLGVMSTVIVALYRLLIGRLTRAENQVDTGLGSLEKLADSVAALKTQHDEILVKLTSLERRRS